VEYYTLSPVVINMQKIEQKVSSNGDRCAKAATEGAPPTVTPALIKNAAAALAELMRQHESGGIHKVRPSTLSTLMSLQKLGEMSPSDDEVVDVNNYSSSSIGVL